MKTAISVEDSLMQEADGVARELGLSRSGLIAEALRDFLKQRRGAKITERLNQVYAKEPTEEERRIIRNLRTKLPIQDRW